jgi:hypothetical protein
MVWNWPTAPQRLVGIIQQREGADQLTHRREEDGRKGDPEHSG